MEKRNFEKKQLNKSSRNIANSLAAYSSCFCNCDGCGCLANATLSDASHSSAGASISSSASIGGGCQLWR